MKKIKFLTLLFIAVTIGFTSCKKKEDEIAIIGKWKKAKEVQTEYVNGIKGAVTTDTSFGSDDYIEYKSNGVYTVSDDLLTLDYKIEGNKIIYSDSGFIFGEETIISSTSSQLILEETDDEGNGNTIVTERTYTKM